MTFCDGLGIHGLFSLLQARSFPTTSSRAHWASVFGDIEVTEGVVDGGSTGQTREGRVGEHRTQILFVVHAPLPVVKLQCVAENRVNFLL